MKALIVLIVVEKEKFMGVDYRNVIIYGKEFDSFICAMDDLLYNKIITDEEYEDHCENGEYYKENSLIEWEVYSCYTGGVGILGLEVSAKNLYTQPEACQKNFKEVDKLLGDGCEVHEFVQVC